MFFSASSQTPAPPPVTLPPSPGQSVHKNPLKNTKVAIAVIIVLTISILSVSAFVITRPSTQGQSVTSQAKTGGSFVLDESSEATTESKFTQLLAAPTVTPISTPSATPTSTLALQPAFTATLSAEKRVLTLQFTMLDQVSQITYTVSYSSKKDIRGATGTIPVTQPAGTIKRDITLGTCSNNVCTYDVVSSAITVKIVFQLISGSPLAQTFSVAY